jgi:pyruvate,water dikinase
VLSEFSDRGFRRAFGALGCSVPPDAELVAEVRGRIDLNLSEFMAIAAQVPGLSPRVLLSLAGGGGLDELERAAPEGRLGWFLRLPRTASRFLSNQIGLAGRVESFEAWFEEERARFLARDLRRADRPGLVDALRQAQEVLARTGEMMLSAASSFLASYVLLRTLLARWIPDRARALEASLLTGLADLESAAPGIALCHVAAIAARDPAAREALLRVDAAPSTLDSIPDGPLRRALVALLEAHGHRAPREAEIATARWREDPTMVLAALRAILLGDAGRVLARIEGQRGVRADAMRQVDRSLSGAKRSAVRHAVAATQRGARVRERLRARVTDVLGWYRAVALEVGRRMGDPQAAFFLQTGEIGRTSPPSCARAAPSGIAIAGCPTRPRASSAIHPPRPLPWDGRTPCRAWPRARGGRRGPCGFSPSRATPARCGPARCWSSPRRTWGGRPCSSPPRPSSPSSAGP